MQLHGSRLPQWYFVVPQRKPRVLQCYYSNTAGLEQPARQGCVGPWRLRHPPASSSCPPGERTTITARFTSFFRRAIFFSACNACVWAGGGRCGLPRQRSYACRRRRRRALAPGRSMGTIGRSRRLGTAWYNSVDQVRPQGKYATAADSDTAAAASQAARRPRVWRRRRLRRCQRRRTA